MCRFKVSPENLSDPIINRSIIVSTRETEFFLPSLHKMEETVHPEPVEEWVLSRLCFDGLSANAYVNRIGLGKILEEYVFSIMDFLVHPRGGVRNFPFQQTLDISSG